MEMVISERADYFPPVRLFQTRLSVSDIVKLVTMATHRQNSHSGPLLLDCPDEEQEGELGPSDTSTMDLTSTNTLANTRRESGNRERPGYRESRDQGTEHPMDTLALGNAEQLWGTN